MAIKPEAERYFSAVPREKDLAQRLDEVFNVTFRNTHGGLSFWLAEPKPRIKERFGLHQEVLVIYSPHQKTDARALTAIENITRSPDFKHRLEKVLILLVHEGTNQDVEEIIANQTDWVILPVHANELLSSDRGPFFLRSRLSQRFSSIDLFGVSSPITQDKYFFGREELLQSLVNRSLDRHENLGLFGLRKTGKTSILFATRRRLSHRPVLTEYIDCQNPGVHSARWWQVLENLAIRCAETLRREHKRECPTNTPYTQSDAGTKFSSTISALLTRGSLNKIILMLDEVEYITPKLSGALGRHWDNDFVPFWQAIRATHQETQGRFSFVVAGVNPACVEKSHFDQTPNPIFQLAIPQYLESLSVANVREMVRSIGRYSGLHFDESVFPYLQQTYGGHPYLIRIACSEVWRASDTANPDRLQTITIDSFRQRRPEINARLSQPIRDILLSLVWWYPEEYDLLRILASGDAEFVTEYLKGQPESIIQFARYGILRQDAGQFAIADLREFLNEHGEAYKNEISPFIRGDMPPELLPEVPNLEMLGNLFKKKSQMELKLRRAINLYLGVKHNWDPGKIANDIISGLNRRPDRKQPKELFVGRTPQEVLNELFTLDLKSIILANWEMFKHLFDNNKTRFEMNMDTLNKARRVDSHTTPVSADEALEFENSYLWILNRLKKVPE